MNKKEALLGIDDRLDALADYHKEDRDAQHREIDGATYRALRYCRGLIESLDTPTTPTCATCQWFEPDCFKVGKHFCSELDTTHIHHDFHCASWKPKL